MTINVSNDVNRKQLTLYGSWMLSKNDQAECARFVSERKIDVDQLFTNSWPLEHAVDAYRLFDTQTMGKGFLVP